MDLFNEMTGNKTVPSNIVSLEQMKIDNTIGFQNKIKDASSFLDQLNDNPVICQESAKFLNEIAPGFLTEKRIVQQFTKQPSRAFVGEAIDHLKSHIAKEELSLTETFETDIKNYAANLRLLVGCMPTDITNILSAIQSANVEYPLAVKNYKDNPNMVVPAGTSFISVIDTPIADIVAANISVDKGAELVPGFLQAINSVNTILETRQVQTFIAILETNEDIKTHFDKLLSLTTVPNLNAALSLYDYNKVTKGLEEISSTYTAALEYFNQLIDKIESCEGSDTLKNLYHDVYSDVKKHQQIVSNIIILKDNLLQFYTIMPDVLAFLHRIS